MAVTFDIALGTSRDRIRFTLAQTVTSGSRVSPVADETIDALIASAANVQLAASYVAQFLASYWAQRAMEVDDDGVRAKYIDRAKYFQELAVKLASGVILVIGETPIIGFSETPIEKPDLSDYRST